MIYSSGELIIVFAMTGYNHCDCMEIMSRRKLQFYRHLGGW